VHLFEANRKRYFSTSSDAQSVQEISLQEEHQGEGRQGHENRRRHARLKEAAEYLGRSARGMRELVWKGEIPYVRPAGSKKIYFDIVDLDEFVEKNKCTF
jgi:excisionase family DNA binding protein